MSNIKIPKKLIEVALPLEEINEACQKEKNPFLKNHPRGMHLWWARRPLAAARAILFAQLVNDPGGDRGWGTGLTKAEAALKREKLFDIIRNLVKWENSNNQDVINAAKEAIKNSWEETCYLNRKHPDASKIFNPEILPDFHDPFAGGGAIPLEAQRLGLNSFASDLNPVAVMINKALIEIPVKFIGMKPIGPIDNEIQEELLNDWSGAKGLSEDVLRYGKLLNRWAREKLSSNYPKVEIITGEQSQELDVIAWLWVRTVKSPNPAYSSVDVPLATSFVLSTKKGNESYVAVNISGNHYSFEVMNGEPPEEARAGTKASGRGANFRCILSGSPISGDYIKQEGQSGRIGQKLLAIVANGKNGKIYISPTSADEKIAFDINPTWKPVGEVPPKLTGGTCVPYGMSSWGDLFTNRQLNTLATFSDLVAMMRSKVEQDALGASLDANQASNYADAICTYLGLAASQYARYSCTLCSWNKTNQNIVQAFGRQAIPMVWDFAEANPLEGALSYSVAAQWVASAIPQHGSSSTGQVIQQSAQTQDTSLFKVVSTDPPYYDNISYADLSDFFYVWMRKSLRDFYPTLFSTMAVPKAEELVATAYRHGGKKQAEVFFMDGMTAAIKNISEKAHPAFPVTIYYAFKQSETKNDETSSSGWVTFIEAVIKAGFSIDGTWPVKTEKIDALKTTVNALASSIILVCRKRQSNAGVITRREFQKLLRSEMPVALDAMIGSDTGSAPVGPVDLAQSAIGPGMAIFSKYEQVINQDGSPMRVQDALVFINRAITEFLNPESGGFDNDTLFCDDWFSQYGWGQGQFGEADILARAKGTSVDGVRDAGVIESGGGKVRLLKWSEYPTHWDPKADTRTPVWEACHQMIRVLNQQGEAEAGSLLARMPERGEHIRQLAYHLYTLCERKKWAEEARAYNELIGSWHAIIAASQEVGHRGTQSELSLDF